MTVVHDDAVFALRGNPDEITASASRWTAFSAAAAGAADDLRGLDTADFIGDEAEAYRHSLGADLPSRLRTSSQSWRIVGSALVRFSAALADCQSRMGRLRAGACDAWDSVRCARQDAEAAHAADQAALALRSADDATSGPGGYPTQSCAADARLAEATARLRALMDQACSVRAEHDAARDACATEVRRAAGMRFADPPGWFARLLSSVGGWIADHAPLLQGISAVLKQISSIAGLLAMIPVLAPVMGPIAVATGVMAVGIDGAVMAATGRGYWTDLALQAAALLPGARAAMAVGAAETAVAAGQAAGGDGSWTDVVAVAAGVAVGGKGMHARHRLGRTPRLRPPPTPPRTHRPGRTTERRQAAREPDGTGTTPLLTVRIRRTSASTVTTRVRTPTRSRNLPWEARMHRTPRCRCRPTCRRKLRTCTERGRRRCRRTGENPYQTARGSAFAGSRPIPRRRESGSTGAIPMHLSRPSAWIMSLFAPGATLSAQMACLLARSGMNGSATFH
jgi:hypothetical protein